LRKWHSADVHPEQTRNDHHRQRQHRHRGQNEQRAIRLFVHMGGQLFLKQPYALDECDRVGHGRRQLLSRLAQVGHVVAAHPDWRTIQQPEERRRLGRQQTLQADEHSPQRTELRTMGRCAVDHQIVLDDVDLLCGIADDVHQHFRLVA
jgi:hypothetical protein